MLKLTIAFIVGSLLLLSCSQDRNTKSINVAEKPVFDTTDVITSEDTKLQIRAKLKIGAELDKTEFEEIILYDKYFKSEITQYFTKNDDFDSINLVVVYQDRARYFATFMLHVADTSAENKQKHLKNAKDGIERMVESGIFQVTADNYYKINQNGEVWFNTIILTENKKSGEQNYWWLTSPEADFDYLKHKVKGFQDLEGFDTKFIIEK